MSDCKETLKYEVKVRALMILMAIFQEKIEFQAKKTKGQYYGIE